MGVPAFFQWLKRKYKKIIFDVYQEEYHNFKFDNLYLDMNGIIHPCTHPENKPAPRNEEEMFEAIFEYIDKLLELTQPSNLVYMGIDGVAPRAKMNQQRIRRFRASKEAIEKHELLLQKQEEFLANGIPFDSSIINKSKFDTNTITPGTPFMSNLSAALRIWIDKKFSEALPKSFRDKDNKKVGFWRNPDTGKLHWPEDLVVILSDSNVPGEGEHKIMDFIRRQKKSRRLQNRC